MNRLLVESIETFPNQHSWRVYGGGMFGCIQVPDAVVVRGCSHAEGRFAGGAFRLRPELRRAALRAAVPTPPRPGSVHFAAHAVLALGLSAGNVR